MAELAQLGHLLQVWYGSTYGQYVWPVSVVSECGR